MVRPVTRYLIANLAGLVLLVLSAVGLCVLAFEVDARLGVALLLVLSGTAGWFLGTAEPRGDGQ